MTNNLVSFDNHMPIGNLAAYKYRINNVPMLTAEEEKEYATALQEHGDLEAARKLVMSHLRFVASVARGYKGYGLPEADLIQEGNIGLMKAVKRFDPGVGVRLVSFAVHWIKAEIHEYVLRNWRIVKVATTKAQRKLFFNLRKAKKRLGWFTDAEVQNVAVTLGVKPKDVLEMESRLNAMDAPYDGADNDDDNQYSSAAPAHYLSSSAQDPANLVEASDWSDSHTEKLASAMESLDERARDILQQRWLSDKKATLHELAAKYSVSAERIRQLESIAIKKLKESIA